MTETTFSFIPRAARTQRPRQRGITEIRGPYYSAYGKRHLADLFETMGAWIDGVKYAGGSFALMPPEAVKSFNKTVHDHGAYVSTGGWIENVLRFGPEAVARYIEEAKALGFDVVEISAGFVSLPIESMLRLVRMVKKGGLKAKPEVGIQSTPAAIRRRRNWRRRERATSPGSSRRPSARSTPAPTSS